MFEAGSLEFPFVADMPKRERSKLMQAWDRYQELSRLSEEKGMLVPLRLAVKLLGVSKPRVYELRDSGRLEVIDVDGEGYITGNSIKAYCSSERKAGRPVKLPATKAEAWTVAKDFAAGK